MILGTNDNQNVCYAIVRIEILSFFLANPHTRDTLKGFAVRLFMDYDLVAEVMDELTEIEILEKSGIADRAIYRLKVSYSSLEDYLA